MPSPTLAAASFALATLAGPAMDEVNEVDAPQATGPARIVRPGTFHGAELADVQGGPWMGLYRTAHGYHLAPAQLRVESFHDAGDGPTERSGRAVFATTGDTQPLLLLQGGGAWESGAVQTALGEAGLLQPGERIGLDRGTGDADLLLAFGRVGADELDPSQPTYQDYRLQLVSLDDGKPVRSQELFWVDEFGLDRVPNLWFAGDLDRDGRLDVVLDLAPATGGEELVLYLSSAAAPGELVAEVAWRRNMGC